MAFFSRSLAPDASFTPLFRLLDEFDNYSREGRSNTDERANHRGRQHASTFHPKFDVREMDNAFELHGELPGIERDKINLEFTDPQTLVIRGRTERTYTAGNPPGGLVEGVKKQATAITGNGGERAASPKESNNGSAEDTNGQEKTKPAALDKYWLQERSIGEFARTFSFPSRVDQDAVLASLNNGVLSVVVPKAKKHETRRVAIN